MNIFIVHDVMKKSAQIKKKNTCDNLAYKQANRSPGRMQAKFSNEEK